MLAFLCNSHFALWHTKRFGSKTAVLNSIVLVSNNSESSSSSRSSSCKDSNVIIINDVTTATNTIISTTIHQQSNNSNRFTPSIGMASSTYTRLGARCNRLRLAFNSSSYPPCHLPFLCRMQRNVILSFTLTRMTMMIESN